MSSTVTRGNWPLLVAGGLAVVGVAAFCLFMRWDGLSLTVKLTDLTGLLAPLAFAATVIERAVEILISPWRDAGASKLENELAAIKAKLPHPPIEAEDVAELKAASDALDEYRGHTQKLAFA